jgi:hypothetical protein
VERFTQEELGRAYRPGSAAPVRKLSANRRAGRSQRSPTPLVHDVDSWVPLALAEERLARRQSGSWAKALWRWPPGRTRTYSTSWVPRTVQAEEELPAGNAAIGHSWVNTYAGLSPRVIRRSHPTRAPGPERLMRNASSKSVAPHHPLFVRQIETGFAAVRRDPGDLLAA